MGRSSINIKKIFSQLMLFCGYFILLTGFLLSNNYTQHYFNSNETKTTLELSEKSSEKENKNEDNDPKEDNYFAELDGFKFSFQNKLKIDDKLNLKWNNCNLEIYTPPPKLI